jgi:hypothetical protein
MVYSAHLLLVAAQEVLLRVLPSTAPHKWLA